MSAKSENLFMVSLKDAAAGGAIALALFGVLIGMKAEVASGLGGQLGIEYRWAAVAIAVAIVFGATCASNPIPLPVKFGAVDAYLTPSAGPA